jgi:hypothetical protein
MMRTKENPALRLMKTSQFAELIVRRGMRAKLNIDSSEDRRIADKLALSGMPLEWLGAGNWRLPSGKALAEFALQAGFLAPPLFNVEQFGGVPRGPGAGRLMDARATPSRVKHCGKGSGQ